MSRLDDAIAVVSYIYDCLMAYRNIIQTGDCNSCKKKRTCKYAPKVGQMVRYNCPFYEQEGDSDENDQQ